MRSLATLLVYLTRQDRFSEVRGLRRLFCKLWRRVSGKRSRDVESDEALSTRPLLSPTPASTVGKSPRFIKPNIQIKDSELLVQHKLGKGACAEVWAGLLHRSTPVAIKVLHRVHSSQALSRGDVDFAKECDALRQVNHPNLLKFYGSGVTQTGERFIVTELISSGSLRRRLHNSTIEMTWRERTSIALQVATGLAYLHNIPLIHRDIKSENVLIDADGRAVVGDFGTTRLFSQAQARVVVSAFTGSVRVYPSVCSLASSINGDEPRSQRSRALSRITHFTENADGSLTRSAGTLLWMAPEIFRGDSSYGKVVDIYSFGMLLWELVTRETPWISDLWVGGTDEYFISQLSCALQTGRRPSLPELSTHNSALIGVLQRCWSGDPADRPSLTVVIPTLAAFLRTMTSNTEPTTLE